MPRTDAEWEAESDADTLVNAKVIRGDKKRFAAATRHLKEKNKAVTAALKEGKTK